jgi:TetR/AcrR family transcriptional repressor of nem operon
MVGFVGEIPHLSKAAQVSYAEALEQTFNQIAEMLLEQDSKLTREEGHARAISLYSHMLGSVLLSRAVSASQPALADEILRHSRSGMLAGLAQPSVKDQSLKPSGLSGPKKLKRNLRKVSA